MQVTFDGGRDYHDRIRVRRSHGGTFDAIVRNIVLASEVTSIRWTLRVNVSHHNYSQIGALTERLAAALDTSRCTIYFARVGDVGVGYANDLLHTGELSTCFANGSAGPSSSASPSPGRGLPCRAASAATVPVTALW
jgi:uncharacterized protein